MLQASDCAVARIDANKFLGTPESVCDICYQCTEAKGIGQLQCHTSPDAIDQDRLNAAINREVSTLAESEAFVDGCQRGVLIIEGSFILAVDPIRPHVGRPFLLCRKQEHELCNMWSLKGQKQWLPGEGEANSEYIARAEARDNWKLWRRSMHEGYYAQVQRAAVPTMNIVRVAFGWWYDSRAQCNRPRLCS